MAYLAKMSTSKTKNETLKRITDLLFKNRIGGKGLMLTGPYAAEYFKWRKRGQQDKNLAMVDSDLWTLVKAVKRTRARNANHFPTELSNCVDEIEERLGKLDHIHLDLTTFLINERGFYKEVMPVLQKLTKTGTRVAVTYIKARDGKAKKQADLFYNGCRNALLVAKIEKITNRKTKLMDSDYYLNGSNGTRPMGWVVVQLGRKKK